MSNIRAVVASKHLNAGLAITWTGWDVGGYGPPNHPSNDRCKTE